MSDAIFVSILLNMNNKNNSGNGHDKNKIVTFPNTKERKSSRKTKEKIWRKEYKKLQKEKQIPFLNAGKIPPFTRILICSFLIIHIIMSVFLDSGQTLKAFYMFGFIPGYFTGTFEWSWSAPFGIITHMFIHGSWTHVMFNTVMGLAFGMFFEKEFGTRRFIIFFFICGISGAITYFIFNPFTISPVIGASGGLNGLFGAMLILMNQRNQLGNISKRGIWPIITFWIIFMIGSGLISEGNIAWQAHLGGFLAGITLLHALQKGIIKF